MKYVFTILMTVIAMQGMAQVANQSTTTPQINENLIKAGDALKDAAAWQTTTFWCGLGSGVFSSMSILAVDETDQRVYQAGSLILLGTAVYGHFKSIQLTKRAGLYLSGAGAGVRVVIP